ncbi:MAG: hypothetical protein C0498_10830 [Anaerolinea sp.]|nr:hypothetical protein [Anaerolinea sp.]
MKARTLAASSSRLRRALLQMRYSLSLTMKRSAQPLQADSPDVGRRVGEAQPAEGAQECELAYGGHPSWPMRSQMAS